MRFSVPKNNQHSLLCNNIKKIANYNENKETKRTSLVDCPAVRYRPTIMMMTDAITFDWLALHSPEQKTRKETKKKGEECPTSLYMYIYKGNGRTEYIRSAEAAAHDYIFLSLFYIRIVPFVLFRFFFCLHFPRVLTGGRVDHHRVYISVYTAKLVDIIRIFRLFILSSRHRRQRDDILSNSFSYVYRPWRSIIDLITAL